MSLHGENDMPQFRGVLIQARPVLDDNNPVGIFAVNGDSMDNTRLSLCATDTVSIKPTTGVASYPGSRGPAWVRGCYWGSYKY